jgi:hypothetical protein
MSLNGPLKESSWWKTALDVPDKGWGADISIQCGGSSHLAKNRKNAEISSFLVLLKMQILADFS